MGKPRGKKTLDDAATGSAAVARRQDALVTIISPETTTAIDAILVGGAGWSRRNKRSPTFGDTHDTYVTMGDPEEQLTSEEEERAWQQVLRLDDETALTFMYAMSRYLAINNDPSAIHPVTIHVNEMLEYRGFSRQSGGDFRPNVKHDERLRFVSLSHVYVVRRIGHARRLPKFERSQLLVVTTRSEGPGGPDHQPLPYLEEPGSLGVPYEFDIQLGTWAQAYLHDSNRRLLLSQILSYDSNTRDQRIAMRLGLSLHYKPNRTVTVRDLLANAYVAIPKDHPDRFREIVETALDTLQRDRIIGAWNYLDATALPDRRWFPIWLDWQIEITDATARITPATPQRALS